MSRERCPPQNVGCGERVRCQDVNIGLHLSTRLQVCGGNFPAIEVQLAQRLLPVEGDATLLEVLHPPVDPAFAARATEQQPAVACAMFPGRPLGVSGMVMRRLGDPLLSKELSYLMEGYVRPIRSDPRSEASSPGLVSSLAEDWFPLLGSVQS